MTAHVDPGMAPAAARPRAWHHTEYALEAALIGLFMLAACLVVAGVEHPGSTLRAAVPQAWARRLIVGACMGLTAVALIDSPWGRRSGAHLNPAVTLAFLWLGRIEGRDALGYVLSQLAGASLGVLVARALLGPVLAHPAVNYVVTQPGSSVVVAFVAELAISLLSMLVVLVSSSSARLCAWTSVFCGLLVTAFITLEAPLSGMSMNPARTFGSALSAGRFEHLWLYLVAPPLGMVLGALLFARAGGGGDGCAKLRHEPSVRCIFCEARARLAPAVGSSRASEA